MLFLFFIDCQKILFYWQKTQHSFVFFSRIFAPSKSSTFSSLIPLREKTARRAAVRKETPWDSNALQRISAAFENRLSKKV